MLSIRYLDSFLAALLISYSARALAQDSYSVQFDGHPLVPNRFPNPTAPASANPPNKQQTF